MELQLNKATNTFFQGWSILTESQGEQELNRAKMEKLEALRNAFRKAPLTASNEELLAIKNAWADNTANYTIDGHLFTLNNMQLMEYKRGPQKHDGKPTASAILLAEMDKMLNPPPASGLGPN